MEEPMLKAEEPKEEAAIVAAVPAKEGGALVVASVSTKKGGKKGKFQKNKPAADPTIKKNDDNTDNKTKRKVTPAEKAKKLAVAKAGTHTKAKPPTINRPSRRRPSR